MMHPSPARRFTDAIVQAIETAVRAVAEVFRPVSNFLYRHPVISLLLLLALPLMWLLVFYLGSLAAALVQSLYYIDRFSGVTIEELSFTTYKDFYHDPSTRSIIQRSILMSAGVTITCALVAFPLAYYMARFAPPRLKGLLYLAVTLPLWSSYLVRVYAWKLILAQRGPLVWTLDKVHLTWLLDWILELPYIGGRSLSFSYLGLFIVFVYIWIPYMILPINAALERVPKSIIEASGDLGARPLFTFVSITLPLVFPGVVAGSIFTFSLTLGDYIIPTVIGNSTPFIGPTVYLYQGSNFPLAAIFTLVSVVIMGIYLMIARWLGAFNAL